MNDFFARLKRLFEPRPRPPAETIEPTADRPPPPAAESPPVEAAPSRAQAPPPSVEAPAPPVEAVPSGEPAAIDVDDLAEVRAALEAISEVPVTAPEPEAAEPDAPEPEAAEAEAPAAPPSQAATALPPPTQPAVDVPSRAPDRVGDALVLTLGTPPVTFTVAKTSATLGRGQENTIRLDDLSVSRRHARIAYRQGAYWLSDLGSMGGTWVDGTRLNAPRRLAAGEVIDIGLCRLTVDLAGGAANSETKNGASKPRSHAAAQVRRRR